MKSSPILAATLLLILGDTVIAKDWNGVFPLLSTRADVVRLFGKPATDYPPHFSRYLFDQYGVAVFFEYADKECDEPQAPWGRYNVPTDSVLTITIFPYELPSFAGYPVLNRERLKRLGPDSNSFVAYFDEDHGISYSVRDDKVNTITYGPTAVDEYLRCLDH